MEKEETDFVKWFSELSNKDISVAGGKGASLAEMYNLKIPVPPGFVITAQAYSYFIEKTGIKEEIEKILSELDINDTAELNNASKRMRGLIENAKMPKEMEEEILEAYEILNAVGDGGDALGILERGEKKFVAVRSSATTEDLADASFAGQQDSFLNVNGNKNLLEKVKRCMSSLFTARAIYYREKKGFKHESSYLAVVVQRMVDSVKSGVMFSKNPTRDDNSIVIEAVWGLGEGIVSGKIKPDHYIISGDLENFKIIGSSISNKKIAIIRNSKGENETIKLGDEKKEKRVLDSYEIKTLSQYGKKLQEHYGKPQDIEFAVDNNGIYIVQSRPITTKFKKSSGEVSGNEILSGLGASPGVASGKVKIVKEMSDLEKVKGGDVLVTEMTNPDMVVSMQRASAIVTDEGGVTSHAAIVSREMGIPAVVGTGDATQKLKEEQIITVDGDSGKVYEGEGETKLAVVEPVVPTKTEIKVIVDLPSSAERAAKSKVKGVGLLRLEGIIAGGGKHPVKFVKEKKIRDYIKLISEGVRKIAEPFKEVWIRTSDIRSDEFRNLEGSSREVEGNPMLGNHGVRFSLKHREIMDAELKAVKEVADDFPDKKFGIMVPQIISVEEVRETKKIADEVGIPENIKIGIMVETPAAVQIIDKLCEEGIDFISFGTNDLTQYTLAIDRNNEDVQYLYDEMHPSVLNSLSKVIRECRKHKVKTSICGQAGSNEEMVKFLIGEGIDSISVNADAARKVSLLVAKLEGSSTDSSSEISNSLSEGEEANVVEEDGSIESVRAIQTPEIYEGDIEEAVLKALEGDEYSPSFERKENDAPSLNDAIPVSSELFSSEDSSKEEVEFDEDLGEEWQGERN